MALHTKTLRHYILRPAGKSPSRRLSRALLLCYLGGVQLFHLLNKEEHTNLRVLVHVRVHVHVRVLGVDMHMHMPVRSACAYI
jgi:hypothetical protein